MGKVCFIKRFIRHRNFYKKDTEEITKILSDAGKIFRAISSSTLKQIEDNPEFAQMIETFNNSFVRKNEQIGNTTAHVNKLIQWISDKYEKEALKENQRLVNKHNTKRETKY